MVEYNKCTNQECLSADFCERFTIKATSRMIYFRFQPDAENDWAKCIWYRPNEKGMVFQTLSADHQNTVPF